MFKWDSTDSFREPETGTRFLKSFVFDFYTGTAESLNLQSAGERIINRDQLAIRVFEVSNLKSEFRLCSRQTSNDYFDKYLFETDPVLLRAIIEEMSELVPKAVEGLAGLKMGGIPIATMLSQVTGIPALFIREKPKTYGT